MTTMPSGMVRLPPAVSMMLVVVAASSALLSIAGCTHSQQNGTGTGGKSGTGGAGGNGSTTDGGTPFGIAARPPVQACKPPASFASPEDRLSATGCLDPTDVKKAAASMIPFEVNSPIWSDGADIQRFLAVPDAAHIHVKDCAREPATCLPAFQGGTSEDDGHWGLPVGTVLMQHFLLGGKFVETRLFIHFQDLWYGFSYQWNADQTDALLVPENGLTASIVNSAGATQSWDFPNRSDCLQCHNNAAGGSLGLETRQLDRMMKYPSGVTANQIDTLDHIGMFDALVVRLAPLTDYIRDTSSANLQGRARSYLHANCAICHRPDGPFSAIDLRFGVTLATMNVCNIDPTLGDQAVVGAKRVFPAMPTKSVLLLRMQALDAQSGRMPPVATSVLDTNGIATISAWINSIMTCP
jgi:mono/diheme cytochrome c family protein